MADMSNPTGAIIEERFHLLATDAEGNRVAWGSFMSAEEAEAAFPMAPPVSLWAETYPEYGSAAFERYGNDDLIAWEARHEELAAYGYNDLLAVA